MIAFIDAHAVFTPTGTYVDHAHDQRLRLLIGRASRPLLVCVRRLGDTRDLRRLPSAVQVVSAYDAQRFGLVSWTWTWLRCIVKFARSVLAEDWVIVMYTSSPLSYAGLTLAILLRKRLLSVLIGTPSNSYSPNQNRRTLSSRIKYRISSAVEQLVARHSRVVVAAAGLARQIEGAIPFSTSGLTDADFLPGRSRCNGDSIEWLYVGALNAEKGVDTLLAALAIARASDGRHRATLVGPVDPRFDIHAEIARLHLKTVVSITGSIPKDQVRGFLARADLFVFLSRHEGMPRAPLEALAASLPCIVTPTGADVYVEHEKSGLIVPVGDPAATVLAVAKIVGDDLLRSRLVAGGMSVARDYTYETATSTLHGALARVEDLDMNGSDLWSGNK